MCRCCQRCWEDFYWNCFEERFCYDESIANYNPDDDEDYLASKKNGQILSIQQMQRTDNNNLTVPTPIIQQPLRNNIPHSFGSFKVHEEDFRRETQTNVPMLGPEILAVFANSQIFQDHQPTKLSRINTKTHLAGIHTGSTSPNKDFTRSPTAPRSNTTVTSTTLTVPNINMEQERLIRCLEGNDDTDYQNDTDKAHLHAKVKFYIS